MGSKGNDIHKPDALPLRLTTWPLGALGERPLTCYPYAERFGEWIRLDVGLERDAPPELATRQARDINLDDLDAITNLVRTVGGAPTVGIEDDLPRDSSLVEGFAKRHGRNFRRYDDGEPRIPYEVTKRWPDFRIAQIVHVDEIAARLDILRGLGMFLVAAQRRESVIAVSNTWRPPLPPAEWPDTDDEADFEAHEAAVYLNWFQLFDHDAATKRSAEHVTWVFTNLWNRALSRFSAHVVASGIGEDETDLTILEAGALQLFNDLVTGVAYVPCKRCGRDFNRQIGRAKYRARAEGTVYCSRSCANAASQAAYRARNKAAQAREGT